jgi:hypothetical protein
VTAATGKVCENCSLSPAGYNAALKMNDDSLFLQQTEPHILDCVIMVTQEGKVKGTVVSVHAMKILRRE